MLIHLQRPIPGLPRPEFGGEADEVRNGPGGEGGNRVLPASGVLLAASLVVSAVFVAMATAALFY
jgi:hypothetical protein